MPTYLVTGASGQLGQHVVDDLATRVDTSDIIALVRSDQAAALYQGKGIVTRRGDYSDLASLKTAFIGVDRLLLISSSEVGHRAAQHANVIKEAKEAGVDFIAYTSLLGAALDSGMQLAAEHVTTEKLLSDSGVVHTILRNGWYTENLLMAVPQAVQSGQYFGAAGDGLFSTASRKDYAEAAARVLVGGYDGQTLELAGDVAFTMTEFVEQVAKISDKPVSYVSLSEQVLKDGLIQAGTPEDFAALLADSDANAANGALFNDSKVLSQIIGHPTTPYQTEIKAILA